MLATASALSIPCKAPTKTVLLESKYADGQRTKVESEMAQGMTWTSLCLILLDEILKYLKKRGEKMLSYPIRFQADFFFFFKKKGMNYHDPAPLPKSWVQVDKRCLTWRSWSNITYKYPLGTQEPSFPGHSMRTEPNGRKAANKFCSEISQGTPPRNTLLERVLLLWFRGGNWPLQVHEAS